MEGNLPCDRHEEQIKTLFEKSKDTNKRVDNVETKIDDMTDLKIAITKISTSMEYLIEHNEKQDTLNEKQNVTLENINVNLRELNEGQRNLNNKVDKLEKRVDDNESKHKLDIRDIDKEKKIGLLKKYGEPAVIIAAIGTILLKVIEIFKG